MKKTKIEYSEIQAGDMLEVVVREYGVKNVLTGIAFEEDTLTMGGSVVQTWWKTSEGGMIVTKEEGASIYRIDVLGVGEGE